MLLDGRAIAYKFYLLPGFWGRLSAVWQCSSNQPLSLFIQSFPLTPEGGYSCRADFTQLKHQAPQVLSFKKIILARAVLSFLQPPHHFKLKYVFLVK